MKIVNFEIFKCKGALLSFKRKNKDNPFWEYYGLDLIVGSERIARNHV
mgnify:CR=1 FL=1